ncbi:MAG: metallophosphoesterase [Dehalococcoidia bacterium]|nr:metallophosphoesterase [Dehalococcoidia bacterium]
MVNILVLADTHIAKAGFRLPEPLVAALTQADLILHAGDITSAAVLRELERHAPVHAVAGNNDDPELCRSLPERTIVEAAGYRVGVVHGHGAKGTTFERAQAAFAVAEVDCVVFGHSHQPRIERLGGRLYLNSGSPTQRRREPLWSYAWLRADAELTAEVVRFGRGH